MTGEQHVVGTAFRLHKAGLGVFRIECKGNWRLREIGKQGTLGCRHSDFSDL